MAGFLLMFGCKKNKIAEDLNTSTLKSTKKASIAQNLSFSSDRTYNLNVVYFIPNDLDTLAGYQTNLSDIMLYAQQWFKDEMTRNGYTNKTFGLYKDGANVRISVVRGAQPSSYYGRNGGLMATEINTYFAANPTENSSTHTLVLTPPYGYNPDGSLIEGPYGGSGHWCYAIYYDGMHLNHKGAAGTEGDRWTLYVGGMIHELGHAFNLPHDKQKVSETNTIGKALMYLGNYTLGKTPTILTAADAAIMDRASVFNTDAGSYYGAVTNSISRIWANYDALTGAMVVSGKFSASNPVTAVAYYNDPNVNNEGVGTNKDYNAITWKSGIIGTDSFYVSMPINELEYKTSATPYEMKLKFVHANGSRTDFLYTYNFNASNVPVLDFGYKTNYLSRTGWTIASSSATQSGNPATAVLDGNTTTFWHSRWSTNPVSYPHNLVIDMGAVKAVNGIAWKHREGSTRRAVKTVEILGSTDGVNFTSYGTFTLSNSNDGMNYINLGGTKNIRYFKANMINAWDGTQFAAIAELYAY